MSKDRTPEVGDVWEYQEKLYHISAITERLVEVWCLSSDDIIRKHKWVARSFKACFTYLGKSKANINDLFKTENEE